MKKPNPPMNTQTEAMDIETLANLMAACEALLRICDRNEIDSIDRVFVEKARRTLAAAKDQP